MIDHQKHLLKQKFFVYAECYKKVKKMLGARKIPRDNGEMIDLIYQENCKKLDEESQKLYQTNLAYRQYVNLFYRVSMLEDFCLDFNNTFSINEIFFKKRLIKKTKSLLREIQNDINYLYDCISDIIKHKESVDMRDIITLDYQHKERLYDQYLDQFEKQFKKQFKI
ncbi:hypothetical protein [Staphylococcus auricularis]|uniref:hypothetical protein n=1 Tax=Staphylococcus auricularis TaxID=29379 RepID=UPI001245999F|nr:hypothetical protein [Staphylococcus auricularis]MCG7342363.1 hypothetical protein [Staphylococcus auricularis]